MGKFIDLTGKKYGRLTVLSRASNYVDKNNRQFVRWNCLCDCGNSAVVKGDALRSGNTSSCGCYSRDVIATNNKKYKKQTNRYDLSNEFGVGYTCNQEPFYFDLEDYEKIKDYSWSIDTQGYVVSNLFGDCKHTTVKLHRLIMGVSQSDIQVDHIDHKKYDNRKKNLRLVNNQQNCMNRSLQNNNTSGTAGVTYNKDSGTWTSRIYYKNETIYLGCYHTKEQAIAVRKQAENDYYGEYSYSNSVLRSKEDRPQPKHFTN